MKPERLQDTMAEAARMVAHAQAYLASAHDNALVPLRQSVAFDEARHAAEVARKALFLRKTGTHLGKQHAIAGRLAREGLVPASIDPRDLSDFLMHHTRGAYGFFEDIPDEEVRLALDLAEAMVAAAQSWPNHRFQPPRGGD